MPFLSIFRKEVPKSPAPVSPTASKKSSFSRGQSRPSFASSRAVSPPGDVSPQSELDYVLPELDEFPKTEINTGKRRLFGRRGGSTSSGLVLSASPATKSPPRPFSEALDTFMTSRDTSADRDAPNIRNSGDSDDDVPLVPPPPRASVFAGFSSDQDRPRSQSLPDNTDRPRPARPQAHPHQQNTDPDMAKSKRPSDANKSGGLFSWRSKPKESPPVDPDSSFSLKSFRHVGPAPSSPVALSDTGSTTNLNTPPSSFSRSSSAAPTARPVPGRSAPTTRERVSSVGSEGMMPAGLFRQAARRSSTNLVEEVSDPKPRIRDNERRGPPTRTWDTRDDTVSSGSERPPSERIGRSSSAIPYVGRKSTVIDDDDSTPESPSPFAGRLSQSPFGTRSDYGHGSRVDYSMYASRSDGGNRSTRPGPRPSSPAKSGSPPKHSIISHSSILSSSPPSLSLGFTPAAPPTKRSESPTKRSNSPTKPRHSAPAPRPTRSPIRTTIPTKTNDGPSIKPTRSDIGHARQQSGDTLRNARSGEALRHARQPSGDALRHARQPSAEGRPTDHHRRPSGEISVRSINVDVVSHARRPSGFEVVSRPKSPAPSAALHSRAGTVDLSGSRTDLSGSRDLSNSRSGTTDSRPKTPVESRAKSPAPTMASRAKSPAPTFASRAKSPTMNARPGPQPTTTRSGSQPLNTSTRSGTQARAGYVPPPRQSSLYPTLVDSDSDESPEETESGSDEFGHGAKKTEQKDRVDGADSFGARVVPGAPSVGAGAMRGKTARREEGAPPKDEQGLSRERTITQRDRADPPRIGVSLFDKPMPPSVDSFGPPSRAVARTRASHSTSAISAAATARNSAAMADANRTLGAGRPSLGASSHMRAPAEGTDTDEDEEDEKSESDSDDNAPLASLAPARRPGSAASTAPPMTRTPPVKPPSPTKSASRPPVSRGVRTQPLVDVAGPAPARPPRRVPGVGVTRNSSLRGSRSVEDLGRVVVSGPGRPGPRPSAPGHPGPRPSVTGHPGPRPFVYSPPSSTGDSSSGKAPLTPRDGSDPGAVRRSDEARRKERRRSEAKASVDLANVINGPGPVDDDDDEDHSPHHSQLGHGGMIGTGMGMGWNQPGFMPQGGFGFPASQSMPFLHPQLTGAATAMGFMPPPPPPGASEAYLVAHQQAMMIAKQTYLSAVAQQAMAAATEQWERSSTVGGGSVYGGSQMGGMSMPMMGMYANSAYAASSYEPSVVGGWGSGSVYGGGQSVYGGGARSEYGGGHKPSPVRAQGHGRTRSRTQTTPSDSPVPLQNRGNAVPPSTWATRRNKGGI